MQRPPRQSLAVFEAPPIPEGWLGTRPIRIIDPLGVQAAWVAPHRAGGLIAWFARPTARDPWHEILGGDDGVLGGEVLAGEPGTRELVPVDLPSSGWAFVERDPTAVTVRGPLGRQQVTVALRCDDGLHVSLHCGGEGRAWGYRLRFRARPSGLDHEAGIVRFVASPVSAVSWQAGPGTTLALAGDDTRHIDLVSPGHGGTGNTRIDFVLTAITGNA